MVRARTLTRSVAARLRRSIGQGRWKPDEPLPSERELAARFQMSRVTARRCLQLLCQEGVIVARSGRGYFPVHAAADSASLRGRRAVVYYYASEDGAPVLDKLHTRIINGANAEAIGLGLHLFAVSRSPVEFTRMLEDGWRDSLRGVLLDWATLKLADQLRQRGVPFVVVEDDIEGLPVASVIQDNPGGTAQAMAHLADRGHQRIGIIVNSRDDTHSRERVAAYREFHLHRNLPVSPELVVSAPAAQGQKAMARLLNGRNRPSAVYVTNRGLLAGVLEELKARRLRCPRDISLVVWGEPDLGDVTSKARDVTHLAWDAGEMGRLAIRTLESVVRGDVSGRLVIRVSTQLVDRGSVAMVGPTADRAAHRVRPAGDTE